jgi:hypothetical protein
MQYLVSNNLNYNILETINPHLLSVFDTVV